MKKKFKITGMSCTMCAGHVEKAALSVKGVTSAQVNLVGEYLIADGDEAEGVRTGGFGSTDKKEGGDAE